MKSTSSAPIMNVFVSTPAAAGGCATGSVGALADAVSFFDLGCSAAHTLLKNIAADTARTLIIFMLYSNTADRSLRRTSNTKQGMQKPFYLAATRRLESVNPQCQKSIG